MPVQAQAKDSRSVLAGAVPTGTKTVAKLPAAKIATKGKKQDTKKKNVAIPDTESTGDNEKTKPQVTHELSMVRFCKLIFLNPNVTWEAW